LPGSSSHKATKYKGFKAGGWLGLSVLGRAAQGKEEEQSLSLKEVIIGRILILHTRPGGREQGQSFLPLSRIKIF